MYGKPRPADIMDEVREPDLLFRYRNARLIAFDNNHITFESRCLADGKIKTHWCSYYKKHRVDLKRAIEADNQVNLLVGRYIVPINTEDEQKKFGKKSRIDDILEQVAIVHSN